MKVQVKQLERSAVNMAIINDITITEEDRSLMVIGFNVSQQIYVGKVDDKIACIWGIVCPTILSTRAGIWLYTTDLIKDHPFTFTRHSQMVIKELLKDFETIEGETNIHAEHSKRWLRWLGATFSRQPNGDRISFIIRRH